ncbi:MAG: hypothetical protein WCB99_04025 [Candidatus Cybelea sp.]
MPPNDRTARDELRERVSELRAAWPEDLRSNPDNCPILAEVIESQLLLDANAACAERFRERNEALKANFRATCAKGCACKQPR